PIMRAGSLPSGIAPLAPKPSSHAGLALASVVMFTAGLLMLWQGKKRSAKTMRIAARRIDWYEAEKAFQMRKTNPGQLQRCSPPPPQPLSPVGRGEPNLF